MSSRRVKHECTQKCKRICDGCQKSYVVHGMNRWCIQSVVSREAVANGQMYGIGGLICDSCAKKLGDLMHGGLV